MMMHKKTHDLYQPIVFVFSMRNFNSLFIQSGITHFISGRKFLAAGRHVIEKSAGRRLFSDPDWIQTNDPPD